MGAGFGQDLTAYRMSPQRRRLTWGPNPAEVFGRERGEKGVCEGSVCVCVMEVVGLRVCTCEFEGRGAEQPETRAKHFEQNAIFNVRCSSL